ncbi:disintegrin and metalloproteinase domain-containing protein 9-like isoform X1 [Chiloscyllium plagiosum]|uniref:disintegrin and metalloproteinase domain-containing protein 9-like isoform X1 n=1 Tax=Chiloscyllium plagiosum TaxID=36176 RepID=UPI001CB7ED1B|nr:disintegrin and metalloproteinase domain-containing protein 9-like isoform X1 [Chiloscyllium plagiosum]
MAGSLRKHYAVFVPTFTALFYLVIAKIDDLHSSSYQTLKLSAYEITIPQQLTEREKRDADLSPFAQGRLSYSIQVEGREHIVHMKRNEDIVPKDFKMFTYSNNGSLISTRPDVQDHCHFKGYVEGMDNSMVALSTCSGLRGLLQTSDTHYAIEPLESSSTFQHIVYRMEDLLEEHLVCGVSDLASTMQPVDQERAEQHSHDGHSMTGFLRNKRAILPQTRYVELFLVVDKDLYDMTKNETAVREQMVQLANYLDGMYSSMNIRIVLVGLEIWSRKNQISIEGGAGEVLGRFVQWRERDLLPRRRHDTAHLILKKGFGETAGMAFVSTICSRSHSGGINVFSQNILYFASIVAHELGHNLGMNHDNDRNCNCEAEACIMNAGATGATNFSSCSADDFEAMILNRGGSCLLNIPTPEEEYSPPFCGNKLVDMGEECDCGSPKECENDPCCEASTCKLKYGAQCAFGICCKKCKFRAAGTVCRASTSECDLPEYCNGTSQICQADVFVQDGHPCNRNNSYCYNGACQSYDAQCVNLFGQNAKSAPHTCFQEVNSKGDRFGNCGSSGAGYKKCEIRNSMCGKLQCENVDSAPVFGIRPSIIQTPIGGTTCWGVDFRLGSDVPDPGMVNPGTRCDTGKICMDFKCVDASILKYDCDVQIKCNGHGVCNSNKNCHCDRGWAPPDCANTGYGGSIDSGPTYDDKDTTLRDGLLVFFLLVAPLILLAVYVFVKRNELKRRFCWKRSSQTQKSENRAQPRNASSNSAKEGVNLLTSQQVVQTASTTVPTYVVRPSPARPPPPCPAPSRTVPMTQRI